MSESRYVVLNRHERRKMQAITRRTFSKSWGEWEHRYGAHNPLPPEAFERSPAFSAKVLNGWCNDMFAVWQLEATSFPKIMLRKHDSTRVEWAELQRIKNELFGAETMAIQFLPKQSDLVDEANMYWFYLVPKPMEELFERIIFPPPPNLESELESEAIEEKK